jgi:multiple sugar transport system ATP-binding protein
VAAKVHHIENHGVEKIVTLRVDEHFLKATVPATLAIAIEDSVKFGLNPEKVHAFNGATGVNLIAA